MIWSGLILTIECNQKYPTFWESDYWYFSSHPNRIWPFDTRRYLYYCNVNQDLVILESHECSSLPGFWHSNWQLLKIMQAGFIWFKGYLKWFVFLIDFSDLELGNQTILQTLWNSEQKMLLLIKLLFFIRFWWNLVKLWYTWVTTTSPSFIKIRWKTKKFY